LSTTADCTVTVALATVAAAKQQSELEDRDAHVAYHRPPILSFAPSVFSIKQLKREKSIFFEKMFFGGSHCPSKRRVGEVGGGGGGGSPPP